MRPKQRNAELTVQLRGFRASGEDMGDFRSHDYRGKIIGHRITDTGIPRSIDVARLNHIPPYGDAKRNPYATPQSGPGPGTRADNHHHGKQPP